ncbi:MAG: phenylalanine--tRNA ligase subunit beta [Acidobacteria bacterium]|nr:phenylalanine--tRNA ligase subunit beta [Acidobacteriota bacterium]
MRISLEWLRDYVDVPEAPEKLKDDLTMIGLAVESIDRYRGSPVLDLEITANRPDCLNHLGVAREIAALYGRKVRRIPTARRMRLEREALPFSVEIADADLGPRYCGLVMTGIRLGASPDWMQRRLEAAGMRPVNNIVDITNYVLLELGHPLHAFDFDLLRQGRIVVARADAGERFTTLDGVERTLDRDMLMIRDGAGSVAIAGVMGGLDSEISDTTRSILLECAYFKPSSVRRTSKRLGLSTEASYRFERGADWEGTVPAIARTCHLVRKYAGGRIAGSLQDAYPNKLQPVSIELSRRRAENLLGVALQDSFIISTLRKLNFRLTRAGRSRWRVTCPTYRADMELEADLIEEVARYYGYQKIPTVHATGFVAGTPSPVARYEEPARRTLLGLGYSEAVNLSFADREEHSEFLPASGSAVRIRNPLTAETEFLRGSLVPGLVRAARHNFNHDRRLVRLFEIGKIYRSRADDGPDERSALGLVGTGSHTELNWAQPTEGFGFFHLKGVVSSLLRGLRSRDFEIRPAADVAWLHPAEAAELTVEGRRLGVLGSLHPDIAERRKLKQTVYAAELDFAGLAEHLFRPVQFEPLPRYPGVERDQSVVLSKAVAHRDVRAAVLGLGIPELERMELMDVWEGKQVPPGKVSLLLRFIFLDRNTTLTVDRVQAFVDNIRSKLRDSFDAEFR